MKSVLYWTMHFAFDLGLLLLAWELREGHGVIALVLAFISGAMVLGDVWRLSMRAGP